MKSRFTAILVGLALLVLFAVQTRTVWAAAPIIPQNQVFTIPESAGNGDSTSPANVEAFDPDDPTGSIPLKYSELGGSGAALFDIAQATGKITFVGQLGDLDFETTKTYTLVVKVEDTEPTPKSDTETVTINVTDVSDEPPIMAPQTFSVAENTANNTVIGTIVVTDGDTNDTLTFSVTGGNGQGVFDVNSQGQIRVIASAVLDYELPPNTYQLDVEVDDLGGNGPVAAAMTIDVLPVDEAPKFDPFGTFSINEDAPNGTVVGTVKAIDPEGQAIVYTIQGTTPPFAINAVSGQITVANSSALDFETQPTIKFKVRATDPAGKFSEVEVTVNVLDVNDAPKALGIPNEVINEGAGPSTINLRNYFTDDEDTPAQLQYFVQSVSDPQSLLESTSINGNDELILTYKPTGAGIATITIRAEDTGGKSTTDTFNVDVNDAPTAPGYTPVSVNEDAPNTTVTLGEGFNDAEDSDAELNYEIISNSNGGLFTSVTIAKPNLILDYAPNANGIANIVIKATDTGGLSAQTTLKVTVVAVNDKPTASTINDVQVQEDAPDKIIKLFLAFDDVEDADTDMTYAVSGNTNPGLFAPAPSINQSNGELTLKFKPNTSGESTLTVKATDTGGLSAETSFKVTVGSAADKPVVSDFGRNTDEDTLFTFSKKDFTDHFTDDDGEPLVKVKIVSLPPKGTLKLGNVVLKVNDQINADDLDNLTFLPVLNWDSGSTTFEWNASDGTDYADKAAKVTITVKAVNDAPEVFDFSKTGDEDKTINFSKNDFIGVNAYLDVEDDPLVNIEVLELPANGTLKLGNSNVTVNQKISAANLDTLKFVPDDNWSGTTSFEWTASDGQLFAETPATITITINPLNDPPKIDLNGAAGGTGYAALFNSNAGPVVVGGPNLVLSDVDGDQMTYVQVKIDQAPDGANETLSADKSGTAIKVSFAPGTRTLRLEGPDTIANFIKVLKTVTYDNQSDTPDTKPRDIRFQAYDGTSFSNTATTVVDIVNPRISLTVTPPFQTVLSGDTAAFTIDIVNNGDVDLENITLSSTVADCDKGLVVELLEKGDALPAFNCVATNVTERIDNVLVVTADDTAGGPAVTATATGVVRVSNPNIGINIAPDPTIGDTVPKGADVTFDITLINPSESRLKDVVITAVQSPLSANDGPQSVAPNEEPVPVPECSIDVGVLDGKKTKEYSCTLKNVQGPFSIEATAVGTVEGTNMVVEDFDLADINILEILVQATADQFEIPAGKATDVEFSVTLTNDGSKSMTLTQLLSEDGQGNLLHGDLLDPSNTLVTVNNCAVNGNPPVLGPNGGTYTCAYQATVVSQALSYVNVITVEAEDFSGNTAAGQAEVILAVNDEAGLRAVLTANPPALIAPGGNVELNVQIINNQSTEATLDSLSDGDLGDLDGVGTCAIPQTIAAKDSYTCSYSVVVVDREPGQQVLFTLTAVVDDETLRANVSVPVTTRGAKRMHLPSVASGAVAGEPNNGACSAMAIMPNSNYWFLPDDAYDFYELVLPQATQVRIMLSDYVGVGQIATYKGDCINPTFVMNDGTGGSTQEILLESAEPGRYFILVYTSGNRSTSSQYKLRVETLLP